MMATPPKQPAAPRKTAAKKPAARKPAAAKAAPRQTAKPAAKPSAKSTAKPTAAQSAADTIRATLDRVVEPARKAAESVRGTLSDAGSQGATFSLKMIEQAEHNAREAFNAMRAAAKSKDMSEVLKVQGDFLREQGARSIAQAREVGEMIAKFGREAIAPLTGGRKK